MIEVRTSDRDIIFKIVEQAAWKDACCTGTYFGSEDDKRDGFIHFSAAHQLSGTARKYFVGQNNLLLVAVRADTLGDALKWEPSRDGDLFPHLYAPLGTSCALYTRALMLGSDQVPILPQEIVP